MRLDDRLVRRLYAQAKAERWGLSLGAFASSLLASAQREFGDASPDARQLERYLSSLHLNDLALACACAEGGEEAWETFVREHRPALYRAADALDASGAAREAADSLYGELFGLREREGQRRSHLRYFHGRSSLATWLRAVLAQRYVDQRRRWARLEPLPNDDAAEAGVLSLGTTVPSALARFVEILRHTLTAVIAALPARHRLRLRCYYAQGMTLAEIGRVLSESEATTSRKLAKTRRAIREQVERRLRDQERMSEADIADSLAAAITDSGPLDLAEMLGTEPILVDGRKKVESSRSK